MLEFHDSTLCLKRDLNQKLLALDLDLGDYPDLVLPLSIAAMFAESSSRFYNIRHLNYKESKRLDLLHENLQALGVDSEITTDSILIHPSDNYHGAIIDPHNDHRIAMSFAIAGLKIQGIIIKNHHCINKSYPNFFNDLEKIQ